MKLLKVVGVVAAIYIVFVALFEGVFLGYNQPKLEGFGIPMLVLTTTDASGEPSPRRLARIETDGKLYVSTHHWPRGWYHEAVANPDVQVEIDGITEDYVAVPVEGEEFQQVAARLPLGVRTRFLMGFPPERDILRLDRAGASTAQNRPNIVLIMADDLGYADLGFQGVEDIPTPSIDALAAGGVRFTSGYVSSTWCSPTRAGLMTGRYQQRFGEAGHEPTSDNALSLQETTLADRLQAAGYATGLIGKWHLAQLKNFIP